MSAAERALDGRRLLLGGGGGAQVGDEEGEGGLSVSFHVQSSEVRVSGRLEVELTWLEERLLGEWADLLQEYHRYL